MRPSSHDAAERRRQAASFPPTSHPFRPSIDPRYTTEAQRRQIVWPGDEDDDTRREDRFKRLERKQAALDYAITCPNTRIMLRRLYYFGDTSQAEAAHYFGVHPSTFGHWKEKYFQWLRTQFPREMIELLFECFALTDDGSAVASGRR